MRLFCALLFAIAIALVSPPFSTARANSKAVNSKSAACSIAKNRVSAKRRFPLSKVASCDVLSAENSPRGFYVLALHSIRKCSGICSTNMGWFAVEKATAQVFEWDVTEQKIGPLV